jgi:hypothetical protein
VQKPSGGYPFSSSSPAWREQKNMANGYPLPRLSGALQREAVHFLAASADW